MQSQNKNDGVQLSTRYQQYCFAKQHLRGTPRPEVFPFTGADTEDKDNRVFDGKIRRLTPTECERLQGFEDGWTEGVSDTQRYKTLGNAVTVNVIQDIFEKLL
jgi:site-specific DNA-cytosine methylase